MAETEEQHSETSVPSILIDKDILKPTLNVKRERKCYSIGSETFYEESQRYVPNDFVLFKMYTERRSNVKADFFVGNLSDEENYCWTPDSSSVEESTASLTDEFLDIKIKKAPFGIIINSDVYLTMFQWNTIMFKDDIGSCFVCDLNMTRDDIERHIDNADHKNKLASYKPLAEFELSITRKIREQYHCGVCNTAFDLEEETAKSHYDSKSHEDNKLFAINKVSDFNDDDDIINDSSSSDNDSVDSVNDNDSYDYDCDDDEDYNNEWVIATANNPGLSYANKLKKVFNAPDHYNIELRNKKVKVTYECWHMIRKTKKNAFYCMACKDFYRLSMKIQHCEEAEHLDNVRTCPIVDRFEEHFIRKVGDLYHCGHCNSLQLESGIEDHLEIKHNKKYRKVLDNAISAADNAKDDVKNNNDTPKDKGDTIMINNDTNNVTVNEKSVSKTAIPIPNIGTGTPLFKNILYHFCNNIISLPYLNYNVVKQQMLKYFYCGLCTYICSNETLQAHLLDVKHVQLMQCTPFIVEFGCNMIRNVNGLLHCAICNENIIPVLIHYHIRGLLHMRLLQNALIINSNQNDKTENNNNIPHSTENVKRNESEAELLNNDKEMINEDNDSINADMINDSINADMINDSFNDTVESVIDLEAFVYIRLSKSFFRVTITSYNTLVSLGDGNRYCFVCCSQVKFDDIKEHIANRNHLKNVDECKFVDLFDGAPLRQMYLMYHCVVCNVLMTRTELKDHLVWSTHINELEIATKTSKKVRKNELKEGTPQYTFEIVKESLYEHEKEHISKVLYAVDVVDNVKVKKYKMILVDAKVLKVDLDSWHGIVKIKEGLRCITCQKEIEDRESHVGMEEHKLRIEYPFQKEYLNDLLREINKNILHCLVCNTEVAYQTEIITKHIDGKKHKKKIEAIKNLSCQTDSYTDCEEDMLTL